ncbi:MAG: hypothetical protein JO126_06555 [Alphaproteobacteria bacterium]|nr:hypothetical protein [Alphaproteobacteria bacterium]
MIDYMDVVGLCAVVISTSCYARLQFRREFAKSIQYSIANGAANIMMLMCLSQHWNLASFASNILWLGFSLYGVYRCIKYKWRERAMSRISD